MHHAGAAEGGAPAERERAVRAQLPVPDASITVRRMLCQETHKW